MSIHPEEKESLWALIVSPCIWGAHFLLSYGLAAVFCAKVKGPLSSLAPVRLSIAVFTVVGLAGILWNGWHALGRYRSGRSPVPFDADTPEDRHRFLGLATLLLAGLSLVATLFSAMVALFFEDCR